MSKLTRPLHIPFAVLFENQSTFLRNVQIYRLWNEGYTQPQIAKELKTTIGIVKYALHIENKRIRGREDYLNNRDSILAGKRIDYNQPHPRKSNASREKQIRDEIERHFNQQAFYHRRDYLRSLEHQKAYRKQYKQENKDKLNQQRREKYNSDLGLSRNKAREYYQENKEWWQERSQRYYQEHQEQERRRNRDYFDKNPGLKSFYRRRYYARKRKAFLGIVPIDIVKRLLEKQLGLCAICSKLLGNDVEIDHKIPLSTERSIDCVCNLQATHKRCNIKKGKKILPEFEKLNRLSLQLDSIRKGETYEN